MDYFDGKWNIYASSDPWIIVVPFGSRLDDPVNILFLQPSGVPLERLEPNRLLDPLPQV